MRSVGTAFNSLSLAKQFLLAGGLVTAVAMLTGGILVTDMIVRAVTRNSAVTTALFVDSLIAPILPDMAKAEFLDESVEHALDETLKGGTLGNRIVAFRLWRRDGTILYANEKSLRGQMVGLHPELSEAFSGQMVAEFQTESDENTVAAVHQAGPVLEIYNPVLQPWSGEVVAVAEFYERAPDLASGIQRARAMTWLAVVLITMGFFVVFSLIVFRGSQTIEWQKSLLNEKVDELSSLLRRNEDLSNRVRKASQRVTALNEQFLRRIGADLHDGPAQLVAYAALRMDSPLILDRATPPDVREREVFSVKQSLDEAMAEIRGISHGLVLPEIESLPLQDIMVRVVSAYRARTRVNVKLVSEDIPDYLSASAKICIYRFVQEALNNGWRHADGKGQTVSQRLEGDRVIVQVSDQGSGFDIERTEPMNLGLMGLRERIESIGGQFDIASSKIGTTLTMSLRLREAQLT